MSESPINAPILTLESMIGFDGKVSSGLKVHPDKNHLIYPVGCTVVIENINNHQQDFLSGHTNSITALAVSKVGRYLASGQQTHMGFKADIIVWDYDQRRIRSKLTLHKVTVEALAFSPNEKYLVSLGGRDDGNVVVWDMKTLEAICGSPAQCQSAGITYTVAFASKNENIFATGGDNTLRVWELDVDNRKIRAQDVKMSNKRRQFKCLEFDEDDSYLYSGTDTGDIIAVNLKSNHFQMAGPKELFGCGVTCLSLLKSGKLLVGAGDGTVCVTEGKEHNFKRTSNCVKVQGAVSSIGLRGSGHQFFIGTVQSSIYRFALHDFAHELIATCHNEVINDIAFACGTDSLFGTASKGEIRMWDANSNKELLRISVPNMTCNALEIMRDGNSIISGWDDGRIRAFYPESGKPMYQIDDAHKLGVTALATFTDSAHIVSGGQLGDVRVWQLAKKHVAKGHTYTYSLLFTLKEHKATVTSIKVKSNNKECVTSSTDGSCIIWDLEKRCRCQMIRVNTLFNNVCYHPQEHQIITTGTDRKVGYFETWDGSTIRELEASTSGSINGMDMSCCGGYFVSGGDDRLIKVWKYDEGETTHLGVGHGAGITRVKISPEGRYVLSVSTDGAILRWKFPFQQSMHQQMLR